MRIFFVLWAFCSVLTISAQDQLATLQSTYPDQSLVVLQKTDSLVIHKGLEIYHYHNLQEQVLRTIRPEVLNTSISYDEFSPLEEFNASVSRVRSDGSVETSDKVNKSYQNVMVSGIFYHDNQIVDISYPFFSVGTIASLSYKKKVTQPQFLSKFIFTSGYPTLNSKYVVYCHKSVDIGYSMFNNDDSLVKFTKEDAGEYWLYKWELSNSDAWNAYSYREILESEPHIVLRIKSAEQNGQEKIYLKDMDAFYSWLYDFVDPLIVPNAEMDALSAEITAGLTEPIEKLKAIYDWVQNNITYVAFEDGYNGFIPRKPNDVCHKKYGDCKDMALLLFTLLESANIDASVVWIGSSDIPYKIEDVLSPTAFNHMIACADIDGKRYWLDATAKYLDFNVTSPFTQGKEGLVAKSKTEYEIVTLPVTESSNNQVLDTIRLNIQDKKLIGHRSYHCSGYKKLDFLFDVYSLDETSVEDLSEYFSIGNDSYHQTKFKLEKNDELRNQAAVMNADFSIDNYVRSFGNKVLINPLLIKFSNGKMFDTEKKNTLNFEYKSRREEVTELNLGSLNIQNLPEDIELNSDLVLYSAKYKVENEKLVIHRVFEIKKFYLVKEDAENWNKVIKQINELESDNLILVGT